MAKRSMIFIVMFCLSALALGYAADANEGTWKLNEKKSKIAAGAAKNTTVTYTAAGDSYKCVTEGTDGSGQPLHTEWTGKFDGKDYPVTGDSSANTRSMKKVDARHYKLVNKKDGKEFLTGAVEISPDGKTRMLTTQWKDASGKEKSSTAVYDKQ
ncbi:MAG TPA: hypothetical protein VFP40_07785 [Terriglobales bacterium]|nr:hypothetical protein [Terriglobales bacterium]